MIIDEKIKPLFTIFCALVVITCGIGLVMFFKGRLKEEQAKDNSTKIVETTTTSKKDKKTTTTTTTSKPEETTTTVETTTTTAATTTAATTTKKTTTTTKKTTTSTNIVDGIELGTYTCSENCNKISTVTLYDHYCSETSVCTWSYNGNQLVITFNVTYKKNNKDVSETRTELFEVLPNHRLRRLSAGR